jgi:galactose mutarotase-like enzyme
LPAVVVTILALLWTIPVPGRAADYSVNFEDGLVVLGDGEKIGALVSPEHGGELAGLEVLFDGEWRELIYRAGNYAETAGWRGKAAFLWPAVGISLDPDGKGRGFTSNGAFYPMPAHGFARDRAWALQDHGADGEGAFATLTLASDEGTHQHYPFDFVLSVDYRIARGRLSISYTVTAGTGNDGAMPFSIGNHVTFKAPLIAGGEPAALAFRNDFPSQLIRAGDRTFSGRVIPSPFRGEQPLSVLPRRQAVSLGGAEGPAELTLIDPSGLSLRLCHEASKEPAGPAIRFNLWADAEEGFFSPEPWIGTQNSLNNGAGLIRLGPGENWRWTIEITPGQAVWPAEPPGEKSE